MRSLAVSVFSILVLLSAGTAGRAADTARPAAGGAGPAIKLATDEPPAPKFSDAQIARVSGWMRELAPSAPPAAIAAAAQHFLEDLQWQHPEQMDALLTDAIPQKNSDSSLLRHLAAQLGGAPQAALRAELARRRVQALLAGGNGSPQEADRLIEKLKGISSVYYQRLLEGRIDDDDLQPLLEEAARTGSAAAATGPAKPLTLSAGDILAEFSRHNQSGSALENLGAYAVDGDLKLPDGQEQHLLLFKLRPDRFRLHVLIGGATRYILAGDGTHFWQEGADERVTSVPPDTMGARRYLREFVNPLFGNEEGYTFARLADGTLDGRKIYRLEVDRADGSRYVACIDPDTFHEVGGEYDNGVQVRYSDFREVAGLTMAFREETTDRAGHKDVFTLTRVTPNPGLVQEFFDEPVQGRDLSYIAFEKLLLRAHPAPLSKN